MSQTVASALGNRIVTFVDIDNDFDCVICMQVADDPVRCNGLCAGIFCNGCMQQALTRNRSCPSCKKDNITALKDVMVRNQILKHKVYCLNKGSDDEATKTSNIRKRKASSDEKCTWTGKIRYDDLNTHMKQCGFELVACSNYGCREKIERRELEQHLQACIHRMIACEHCHAAVKAALMRDHVNRCPKMIVTCICSYECTRDLLAEHRDKDCAMTKIQCKIVGCGAMVMRRDYEKHQDDAAKQHVRLLLAAYERLAATVEPLQRLAATKKKLNRLGNDDLMIIEEGLKENDFKCPYSGIAFNRAMKHKHCKHNVDHDSLQSMCRNSRPPAPPLSCKCPVAGCSKVWKYNEAEDDEDIMFQMESFKRTKERSQQTLSVTYID